MEIDKQEIKCYICNATFSRKDSMKKHIAAIHEGKKPFKCSICNSKFARNGHLSQHIMLVHEGKKPFKCSICDYNCSTKQRLTIHIASVHEGKKQYKCNICNHSFAQNGNLQRHISSMHEKKKHRKKKQLTIENSVPTSDSLDHYDQNVITEASETPEETNLNSKCISCDSSHCNQWIFFAQKSKK